jgi:hypothetical protein
MITHVWLYRDFSWQYPIYYRMSLEPPKKRKMKDGWHWSSEFLLRLCPEDFELMCDVRLSPGQALRYRWNQPFTLDKQPRRHRVVSVHHRNGEPTPG